MSFLFTVGSLQSNRGTDEKTSSCCYKRYHAWSPVQAQRENSSEGDSIKPEGLRKYSQEMIMFNDKDVHLCVSSLCKST